MTALAERAVIVTGANRGMGREYVGQLLDRGARRVYAAARDLRTIDITDSRVVPLQLGITRGGLRAGPRHVRAACRVGDEPVLPAGLGLCVRQSDQRTGPFPNQLPPM